MYRTDSPSPQPSPVKGEGEERLFCIWRRGGVDEPAWVDSGHSRPSPFGPSPMVMSAPALNAMEGLHAGNAGAPSCLRMESRAPRPGSHALCDRCPTRPLVGVAHSAGLLALLVPGYVLQQDVAAIQKQGGILAGRPHGLANPSDIQDGTHRRCMRQLPSIRPIRGNDHAHERIAPCTPCRIPDLLLDAMVGVCCNRTRRAGLANKIRIE